MAEEVAYAHPIGAETGLPLVPLDPIPDTDIHVETL